MRHSLFLNCLRFNVIKSTTLVTMASPQKISLSQRLSPLVRPVNYNLVLHPNFETGQFKGTVRIVVNVKHERDFITLHTKSLDVTSCKVFKDNKEVTVTKFFEVPNLEQFMISFENTLGSGTYHISLDFNGNMTNKIIGLYSSRIKNSGKTMVASKFQPTYARQAFPCFDEPEFKATFDVTLMKPPQYIALSNMNEISKTVDKDSNAEAVTFATSVPMSSYLACFVICDFGHKETMVQANGIGKNFQLRCFAQKEQMHTIEFSMDIGKRATEFYIGYFAVPFPLPKLDMIAIPDYVSGATEHWGLVTYRETAFLIDPATASVRNKFNVANTVVHELAHMWFGNLVTLKWWNDLWLNEGFAVYMQTKSLNAIEPSWKMSDQFLIRTLHGILDADAKVSSHPIVMTVETPDQITSIFDVVSYNKGASVIRMLEGFIGEENFRRGVSDYLKKYEFKNTVTQDLLSCMEPYFVQDNPDLNLAYIMDTWTKQMGYPLITVTPGDVPNTYILTQQRFLIDPKAKYANDSEFNYRWFVPITYKTNKGARDTVVWFPDTEKSVTLSVEEGVTWLKINNNQVGYYRVNYAKEMWQALIEQLKSKSDQFTISDRAHLLNEVFSLAQAQCVSYNLALDTLSYIAVEEDYVPWEAASSIFNFLDQKLHNTEAANHLKKFGQSLVEPLYEKLNWDQTPTEVTERFLRSKILTLAVRFNHPDAATRVRSMFLQWLESHGQPSSIRVEPDLRDIVYYFGMKSASEDEWEKLVEIYMKEEDAQELSKLRLALAAPLDTSILVRYIDRAWNEKFIRSQDYLIVLRAIAENPSGTALVWDHIRSHWPQLVERYSLNDRYLGNLIPDVTRFFNTDVKLKEMEAFFAQYPDAGAGEKARKQALETVRNNIAWTGLHQAKVAVWLKSHTTQ